RRGRRPAAAGYFDSDGSGGLCFRALEGTRGREGAPALPVLARGCGGLQRAGNAAGSLSGPPSHSCATTLEICLSNVLCRVTNYRIFLESSRCSTTLSRSIA